MRGGGHPGTETLRICIITLVLCQRTVAYLDQSQIVLDECHKAKNLVPTGSSKPSKTGLTVLQLQKKLPKARIVYCSATGRYTVLSCVHCSGPDSH